MNDSTTSNDPPAPPSPPPSEEGLNSDLSPITHKDPSPSSSSSSSSSPSSSSSSSSISSAATLVLATSIAPAITITDTTTVISSSPSISTTSTLIPEQEEEMQTTEGYSDMHSRGSNAGSYQPSRSEPIDIPKKKVPNCGKCGGQMSRDLTALGDAYECHACPSGTMWPQAGSDVKPKHM